MGEIAGRLFPHATLHFFRTTFSRVADEIARVAVGLDFGEGLCRPVVEQSARVSRPPVERHGHVFEPDIFNAALGNAAHPHAVLGPAADVLDSHVADAPDFCI